MSKPVKLKILLSLIKERRKLVFLTHLYEIYESIEKR